MAFTKEQHAANYLRKKQDAEWYAKHKEKALEHYHNNQAALTEKKRRYYRANTERVKEQNRASDKRNREARRKYYREHNGKERARIKSKNRRDRDPEYCVLIAEKKASRMYGLTVEQLRIARTATHCEICKTKFSGTKHKHVDHCHSTGKYRGMLCDRCNLGLGHFKDNPETLAQAIEYLTKKKEPAA